MSPILDTMKMLLHQIHSQYSRYIFNSQTKIIPVQGYCPEPSKTVLIMHLDNLESGNVLACVTGLMCAWARIILAVLLGVTSLNMII